MGSTSMMVGHIRWSDDVPTGGDQSVFYVEEESYQGLVEISEGEGGREEVGS